MSAKISPELVKQILQDIQTGEIFFRDKEDTTYVYANELTITAQINRGQVTLKLSGYNHGTLAFDMPLEIVLNDGDTAILANMKLFMEVKLGS